MNTNFKRNKDDYTGPKVFLRRLFASANFPDDILITNPDAQSVLSAKDFLRGGGRLIARLDAAYFYKFTVKEILGFLSRRNYIKYKEGNIGKSFEPSQTLTTLVNRYLNRNIHWLLDNADGFIFQSKLSKEIHDKFLGTKKLRNYTIINNGIDLKNFNPSHAVNKWDNTFPNIVISASTYRPNKRLSHAVELTNLLSDYYPDVCLHVIGILSREVSEDLKGLSLTKCKFHGKLDLNLLPEFYSTCDIQFSTSIYDACPNVVVEGLASGLPVITPTLSGAFELIQYKKEWAVDEKVSMKGYENHRPGIFPSYNMKEYLQKVILVIEDLKNQKKIARTIAEENLDIDLVAQKYLNFASSI